MSFIPFYLLIIVNSNLKIKIKKKFIKNIFPIKFSKQQSYYFRFRKFHVKLFIIIRKKK